jgi:hypothetical protein
VSILVGFVLINKSFKVVISKSAWQEFSQTCTRNGIEEMPFNA